MIPYADFTYFGLLLYPLLPTLLLGLAGRISRWWVLAVTVVMLAVQYWAPLQVGPHAAMQEIWILAGYALFQWAVAQGFRILRKRREQRWPFYAAMGLALAPLAVAKWLPVLAPHYQFGFLGISYLTFRSLDVLIGIQDRLISGFRSIDYAAYLLFFPTVSSGPIDRFKRFAADWNRQRTRADFLQDLDGAVHRIFTGFLYKFILAYLIKRYWLDPAARQPGVLPAISYMYAYSCYLFFDFAGYSAFAVGVSYLFGIHTPENFHRPFLAPNIREFWNRWHISLSHWFRDHVYMRFVMAGTRGKWFRNKYLISTLGFFVSMGLMGIWHGTAWHYVLYGLYHGALLAGYDWLSRWNKQRKVWGNGPLWRAASVLVTFHAVCFGLLLFSGHLMAN